LTPPQKKEKQMLQNKVDFENEEGGAMATGPALNNALPTEPVEAVETPTAAKEAASQPSLVDRVKARAKAVPVAETAASLIRKANSVGDLAAKARKPDVVKAKRIQASYSIMKAPAGKFIRTHPSSDYRIRDIPVLVDSDGGKVYFINPSVSDELPSQVTSQIRTANFYFAMTHDGSQFLWPVFHSNTDWFGALRSAVAKCAKNWYSVKARMGAKSYDLISPDGEIPEPDWGGIPSFDEILNACFAETLITSVDHPLVRKLNGQLPLEGEVDESY
jgi:hypothetical protein